MSLKQTPITDPWVFEANNFDYSQDVEKVLFRNELIDSYLSIGQRDKMLYLVGPKGIGKTFLLSYKSSLYRKNHGGEIKFSPANELTENLTIFFSQFSKDDVLKFKTYDLWENIWKFVLLAVSCKTFGINVEDELEISGNSFDSVSTTLSFLLLDRKGLVKTISKGIPKLLNLSRSVKSGVYLFLDGIDQAVDVLVDEKFYDRGLYSDSSIKIWECIHIGLLKAIYDICQFNSHIKIFTSVRNEAFKLIPGGMAANLEGFAANLTYSPSELKSIFLNNVRISDDRKLIKVEAENVVEKFLGYSAMSHPLVHGQSEGALDFILRHTLGRPREIVRLGNMLYFEKLTKGDYKDLAVEDKIEEIRFFIHDKSEKIIEDYLKEIIPSFDQEYLMNFLKKIQSNVFSHKILNDEEKGFLGVCYNTGLVGIIKEIIRDGRKYKIQYFKKAGDYLYHSLNQFPKSEYYITHPILDFYFTKIFSLDFYNNKNIIGDQYEFKDISYIYDYAVSYSSDDRTLVESIINNLKGNGKRVFYDKDFERELLGEELIDYLYNVYNKTSKNVIVFLSKSYIAKKWTSFEWNAIKHKLTNDFTSNFLKIIKIDDVNIPGIVETRAYIDSSKRSLNEIVNLLL